MDGQKTPRGAVVSGSFRFDITIKWLKRNGVSLQVRGCPKNCFFGAFIKLEAAATAQYVVLNYAERHKSGFPDTP